MRIKLYRGKRIEGHCDNLENSDMVHGFLFVDRKGQPKIKWYDEHFGTSKTSNVDPNTVGQETGLPDKNGKMIYEGDIVVFKTTSYDFKPCQVLWSPEYLRFIVKRDKSWPMDSSFEYEIVGNIYDNPELLED